MTKVIVRKRDDTVAPEHYDTVEVMSNGWAKCINQTGDCKEKTQYPPHRIHRIHGDIVYYE